MAWSKVVYTGLVTGSETIELDILSGEYYQIELRFQENTSLTVYTEGSLDTVGALLEENGSVTYDPDNPTDSSYLASGDDDGSDPNMRFTYGSCMAGTYYLLYIQGYRGAAGSTMLHIEATSAGDPEWGLCQLPIKPSGTSYTPLQEVYSGMSSIGSYCFTIYDVMFSESGTAKFKVECDDIGIIAFLTTDMDFDKYHGEPTSILAQDYTSSAGDIDAEISYTVRPNVSYYFWVRPRVGYQADTHTIYVTITPPGASLNPYFEATGSGDTITVNVQQYADLDYDNFIYTIRSNDYTYQDSYTGSSAQHSFTGLSSGTYTIWVSYTYNSREYTIYTSDQSSYIEISLEEEWRLIGEDKGQLSASITYQLSSIAEKRLYSYSFTLRTAGSITISSSGSADMIGWLSNWNQSTWDDTTGRPDDYLVYDDNSGSGSNFSLTYTCEAGKVYYLWFRTSDGSGYNGQVSINFLLGSTALWTYNEVSGITEISSGTTKNVSLSAGVGQVFSVTFAQSGLATVSIPSSAYAELFLTDGNYSYDRSDGAPYTSDGGKASGGTSKTIEVVAGAYYYVWVKGSTASATGSVNVTITPSSLRWYETYGGTVDSPSDTESKSFQLLAGYVYRITVTFAQSGTARFYSTGGYGRKAWLTSSNSGINESTGVPLGTFVGYDDSGDGDYDFSCTVTAGVTYYFYIRSATYSDVPVQYIYFQPPSSTTTTKGWWIVSNGSWIKVTEWDYTNGSWVPAKPGAYSQSDWILGS